jgi:ribosomal protein S18 acetylase RimI-like enzyme
MDLEAAGPSAGGGPSASEDSAVAEEAPLQVRFRPLEEADVPALRELQSALFPVQYPDSFYNRLFEPGYYCQVGVLADGLIVTVASARFLDGSQPAANGSSSSSGNRQRVDVDGSREAYLMTLGVREGFRRHHLGSRAMDQILKLLAKYTTAEYVALHVKSANRAAVRFYERLGWACDPLEGYLPNHYYIDGQHWDAYRYTRALRSPFAILFRDFGCQIL